MLHFKLNFLLIWDVIFHYLEAQIKGNRRKLIDDDVIYYVYMYDSCSTICENIDILKLI